MEGLVYNTNTLNYRLNILFISYYLTKPSFDQASSAQYVRALLSELVSCGTLRFRAGSNQVMFITTSCVVLSFSFLKVQQSIDFSKVLKKGQPHKKRKKTYHLNNFNKDIISAEFSTSTWVTRIFSKYIYSGLNR